MKIVSLVAVLIAAMVGAGFATGREILTFFGTSIPFYIPILVGVLTFGGSTLFLLAGKKAGGGGISQLNSAVFKKAAPLADIFILFNAFVIMSGMLAAMDSLFGMLLPLAPAYSILTGIFSAVIVMRGVKGLMRGNILIVPLVIISIVTVCCFALPSANFYGVFKAKSIPAAFVYVSMNMMLACSIFASMTELSKRQILVGSAVASALITLLLMLIVAVLNGQTTHTAMPMLDVAKQHGKPLFIVSIIMVAVCIFTTLLVAHSGLHQWLQPIIGDKRYSAVLILVAGLVMSNFGFENVVSVLYPIIGVVGLVYSAFCLVFTAKKSRQSPSLLIAESLPKPPKIAEKITNFKKLY